MNEDIRIRNDIKDEMIKIETIIEEVKELETKVVDKMSLLKESSGNSYSEYLKEMELVHLRSVTLLKISEREKIFLDMLPGELKSNK